MNLKKINELSIILSFIKKNLILYLISLFVSLLVIISITYFDKNSVRHENTKVYSLFSSVPINNKKLIVDIDKEINSFRDNLLRYSFNDSGRLKNELANFTEYDCNKFKIIKTRDHEFTIKLISESKNYTEEISRCSEKIENLIIEKKKNFFKSTSQSIIEFKETLNEDEIEYQSVYEQLKSADEKLLDQNFMSKYADTNETLYFLIRDLSEIKKLKFYLTNTEKLINSEELTILYESNKKLKLLNEFKDYMFVVLFFIFLTTLIGFLRIR